MRRRDLLAVVGGAAAFPTFVAAAADKPFRVGIVSLVNDRSSLQFVAFEQRLRELEPAAGQDLTIDFTVLDGHADRFPTAMQEQVQRGADVLLAPGQEVALKAARAATQTIPIVMVAINYDPVALGYVQSLARPGANITGVYLDTIEFAAKRAQLLREAAPGTTRFIVFWDAVGRDSFEATVPAAQALGLKVQSVELRHPPYDYEAALAAAAPGPGDALLCMPSPYFFHDLKELDALAIRHHLPSMCGGVDSGGLIAYAPSLNAIFRSAAEYVDKIRRGAKPAEMPIELPTRFKLVVNLKMAKALDLTLPPLILAQADEVIE
jgi:putative tryptophan/tyrosine transport system substrate-binding protein